MKYYIIAGEASGDLHASNLMKAIKKQDKDAVFRCWGGDLMQAQGGEIVKHYRDLAFMGFIEVAMNLRTILRNLAFCKTDILNFNPDALILVDYPGFNLKIAKFARKKHLKVIYYISPQVWAWKKGRVHGIKKNVDKMLVILPFEKDFYAKYHFPVDFVGHPLLDVISSDIKNSPQIAQFRQNNSLSEKPIIALLPGSRKQEIKTILPLMLEITDDFPEYQFVISGVAWQPASLYENILQGKNIPVVTAQTYPLLLNATAALVTSGTATLETALLGIPEVVCYKGSQVSYQIARHLIKGIDYISLVNLIMEKSVVKELIQGDLNRNNLKSELSAILHDESKIKQIKEDYAGLVHKLGDCGASERAGEIISGELKAKNE